MRQAAINTTTAHPTPISSRFPPVMLASANGANRSGSSPAFNAKVKSTAYSGNTAMRASNANANPRDTSTWSASAPHAMRNAAPTTASPNSTAPTTGSGWLPLTRRTMAGRVEAAAAAIMASAPNRPLVDWGGGEASVVTTGDPMGRKGRKPCQGCGASDLRKWDDLPSGFPALWSKTRNSGSAQAVLQMLAAPRSSKEQV